MANWILALMKVPAEPVAPDGSPDSVRVFRAGKNYYRLILAQWALMHLLVLIGVIVLTCVPSMPKFGRYPHLLQTGFHVAIVLAWMAFLTTLVVSYFVLQMDFDMRWYIVTDRSLRIRSGILSMQELTMTYANIQDIRVTAGPLQGYFKIADLEVRSAGGGASPAGASAHAAYFEGVENAEEIRELILERLRRYRDSGLGEQTRELGAEAAAELVLAEARGLRKMLAA